MQLRASSWGKRLLTVACAGAFIFGAPRIGQAQNPNAKDVAWNVLELGVKAKNPISRSKAVRVLGMIPEDPKALELAESAIDDHDAMVRTAAADALGHIGTKDSVPRLKAMLDDKTLNVMLAAAQALIQLKSPGPAYQVYYAVLTRTRKSHENVIRSEVQQETLVLHDPKQMAQLGFEEGLGFVPYAGIGYSAVKKLAKDDASPVRAAAATKLIDDKDDPGISRALVDAAFDKSWIVRAAALDALAKRDDPSVLEEIAPQLADENIVVRLTAAAAVIRLSDDEGKTPTSEDGRPPVN